LNEHLSWGMMDAIWPSFNASNAAVYSNKPIRRMGEVLYYGRQYMMKAKISSEDTAEKKTAEYEAYHWFGDPAMEIRTERPPQIMVALVPPLWPWALHPNDFTVNVFRDDEQYQGPVEKAKVTISKQDKPSDYWVGETDEEGYVTFPGLVASSLGEYDVVVTASNTVPHTGTFESRAGPGGILLDREVYGCPSEIEIKVADAALTGEEMLEQVISTSGGDEEIVRLIQTSPGSGMFVGTIPAVSSPRVDAGDGTLQVSDGQTITAFYGRLWDRALVDCDPPAFEGLAVAQRNPARGCVELEWAGAYDDHGPIIYRIYRYAFGSNTGVLIGTTWSESYTDFDAAPGGMYRYVVRAQDAAGNEDDNMVEGLVTGSFPTGVLLLLL
jgi:hypothetical protein